MEARNRVISAAHLMALLHSKTCKEPDLTCMTLLWQCSKQRQNSLNCNATLSSNETSRAFTAYYDIPPLQISFL